MQSFEQLSIKAKNRLGYAFITALAVIFSVGVLSVAYLLHDQLRKMYRHPYTVTSTIQNIETQITEMNVQLLLAREARGDINEINRIGDKLDTLENEVLADFELAKERFLGDKQRIAELETDFVRWKATRARALSLLRNSEASEMSSSTLNNSLREVDELTDQIAGLRSFAKSKAEEFYSQSQTQYNRAQQILIAGIILLLLLSVGIAFFLNKKIAEAIRKSLNTLEDESELTASISSQLDSSSSTLAENVVAQTNSIDEISDSTEFLYSNADENKTLIEKMKKRSSRNLEFANRGKENIELLDSILKQLQGASKQIREIVTAIDDIAFQTNLLALNAAVEAARAGQAGEGFAVVAEEVRTLAVKSQEAARNADDIIEQVNENYQNIDGVHNETKKTFANIHEYANQVHDTVPKLASNITEQKDRLAAVKEAILSITDSINDGAASSEELSSVTENLSEEARTLKQTVQEVEVILNGKNSR